MPRLIVFASAAAALIAWGLTAPNASAAPAGVTPIAHPGSGVEEVRMRRRFRHRHRRYNARRVPRNAGNARDPSRPVRQQNQGTTSGGPRF